MSRPPVEPVWRLCDPDPNAVAGIRNALRVDELTARLLVNRGIAEPEAAQRFLAPRLQDMPDPFTMKGMSAAVDRIVAAIDRREKICIWGDYDVDGVTSASELLTFLREIGVKAGFFVPDRFVDGYGLSAERLVELARDDGVELVIAVDCGISNAAEVEVARQHGVDMIVVDHHQVPPELPRAAAVLDPHQAGCSYPEKHLAACGVTWVLLIALRSRLREIGRFREHREPDLRRWLDLVALGTVADMVPLTGLNRVIVRYGLAHIARTARPGVRALCDVADLATKRLTAGNIGFQLGPRINAAGRIARASAGVELLTTDDAAEAHEVARAVDAFNVERRAIQQEVLEAACELADQHPDPDARRTIVLAAAGWHPGVLGIVASKLKERYHRPTVLLALEDGMATGSARSIPGFKLVAHLQRLAPLLARFGGHDHAAGMTLEATKLDEFIAAFEAEAAETLSEEQLRPVLKIDAELSIDAADFGLLETVGKLRPYGIGNPEPKLLSRGVAVAGVRLVGKDQSHVKLSLAQAGGRRVDAIGFSLAHQAPARGDQIDLVYAPDANEYRGETRFQLRVKAMRPAS